MSEGWEWRRLGDVTIPTSTWNTRLDPRPLIRYVDVSAVSREDLSVVSDSEYSADNAPSRARKIVETGDTIFATVRPTLRRIAQIPASLDGEIVSTAFCVLRPDSTQIHPDYLYFAVQIEAVTDGIAAMQTGASYPAVRDADVFSQAIPVPPLQDQIKITHALNRLRASMLQQSKCERVVLELKRATMHTLFTRGPRGEPQKETDIGPVPESWKIMVFHQFISLKRGYDLPISKRRRGAVPVFGSNAKIGFHDRLPTAIPVPGVMVGRSGSVGKVSFSEGEYWPHNTTLYVEHFKGNYEKFVQYFLERFDFHRFASGVSVPTLNRNSFAGVYVGVPSVSEQREIAAVLQAIDRKIDLHRRKRAVLEELFKALLHKLMTGEIGVGELGNEPNSQP